MSVSLVDVRAQRKPRVALIRLSMVVALVGAFVVVPTPGAFAALNVSTIDDELNSDGDCSLREAITAANDDAVVDACGAGSGADTIVVPAGLYDFAIAGAGEDAAATGDLDITEDLTLTGAGAATTIIDANDLDRVVHVSSGTVSITDVTMRDGSVSSPDNGGGILNTFASLTLTRVVVTDNTATDVGGVSNYVAGSMTVVDSTISNNTSASDAGGFYNNGTLTIRGSTINGNSVVAGTRRGGGFYNDGPLTIVNSTISGNFAMGGTGGGIHVGSGSIALLNTTITNNFAASGSAIDGFVASVENTIIANNAGSALQCPFLTGGGHNLDTDNSCFSGINVVHGDPLLGPLALNGGPTKTHALGVGSPAIDAGTNAGCPATDQRGISRPQGPSCDIGAFEFTPGIPVNTLDDELNSDGDCSLREAIQAANTDSAVDACLAGSGADTIILPSGSYALSISGANEDGNQTGDLDINQDVMIDAQPGAVVNAGGLGDRAFDVFPGTVAFSDLKVQNGSVTSEPDDGGNIRNFAALTLTNVRIEDGTATGAGGGIYNEPGATLTLSNSHIVGAPTGNTASAGGGLSNSGTATIDGTTVSGSNATCCGGGIQNNGFMTITGSTIDGNEGGSNGGGILNGGGANMTIDDTDVTNNTASDHPGVANDGQLTITNGTVISGNTATGGGCGGGLWNTGQLDVSDTTIDANTHGCGAGFVNVGHATLTNTTVSNNVAGGGAGGIGNDGNLTIVGGTIAGNSTTDNGGGIVNTGVGTLSVDGTTISQNTAGAGGGGIVDNGNATITNATITGNSAAGAPCCGGGGLLILGDGQTVLDGVTISANTSAQEAGGIFIFGQLTLTNTNVTGNTAANNSGGIHVDSGAKLTMTGGSVSSNSAPSGGGISSEGPCLPCNQPAPGVTTLTGVTVANNTADDAAGINLFNNTVATISNSTISGNDATAGGGGGIANGDSTLYLYASTVSGNTAADGGGGLETTGTATIADSTFSGNTAAEGGGLRNFGTATIDRSTFSGNSANGGGGIENAGTLTIANATISGNSATGDGGGIITEDSGTTVVKSSTISGNSAPTAAGIKNNDPGGFTRIKNTILANSVGSSDCENGTVTSAGHNLIESIGPGCSIVGDLSGNIVGTDPMLGALANNGGPTLTHLPLAGSPVFDAGSPDCPPPSTDQRGNARPIGGACEIGSVEEPGAPAATADLTVVKTDSADPVNVGQNFTYTISVSNAGPQTATNVTLTDVLPSQLAFVSFQGRNLPCSHTAGTVTCTWATLGMGSTVNVTFKVNALSGGTASNTASADADQADPNGASDTETTTINSAPPPGPTHSLTVTRTGTGSVKSSPAGINCGSDCVEVYADGTTVTLTAKTRGGSTFLGWGGDCASAGTSLTCVLVMDADKAVTATFA